MKFLVKLLVVLLVLFTFGNILSFFSKFHKFPILRHKNKIKHLLETENQRNNNDVTNSSDVIKRTVSKDKTPPSTPEEGKYGNNSERGIISPECRIILGGNIDEIRALREKPDSKFALNDVTTDADVMKRAANCTSFRETYRFPLSDNSPDYVTKEELEFPLAYSILTHGNMQQTVLLLSSIYRKHNIHCIHLDQKADNEILQTLRAVAECFPNVFLSTKRIRVVYASVSRLLADIACMKDLLAIPDSLYNWKYLINLCSQDFPLRTNREIVEQLKLFRGVNSIGGYADPKEVIVRTKFVHKIENVTTNGNTVEKITRTKTLHSPPPFNMTVRKNLAYNFYTRHFLQWALVTSEQGQALLNWSMDTYSPDEHFWLMLHTYPGAPGGSNLMTGYQVAREIKWSFTSPKNSCYGQWRHYICVYGAENVHNLTDNSNLFVNKLDIRLDSTGVECLRQWNDERTLVPSKLRQDSNPDKKASVPSPSFYV